MSYWRSSGFQLFTSWHYLEENQCQKKKYTNNTKPVKFFLHIHSYQKNWQQMIRSINLCSMHAVERFRGLVYKKVDKSKVNKKYSNNFFSPNLKTHNTLLKYLVNCRYVGKDSFGHPCWRGWRNGDCHCGGCSSASKHQGNFTKFINNNFSKIFTYTYVSR